MNFRGRLAYAVGTLTAASLLAASYSSAQYAGSTPPPKEFKAGFDSIKVPDLKRWLTYLVDCEGRGSGEPGFQKAAEYMAAEFKALGLKPAGDNGTYFQNLTFYRSRVRPDISSFAVDGVKVPLPNRIHLSVSGDANLEAEVAFLTPQGDDPKIEDPSVLKDKIVIFTAPVKRGLRNQANGAAAVFTLTDAKLAANDWSVSRSKPGEARIGGRVGGVITKEALDRLTALLDVKLENAPTSSGDSNVVIVKSAKKLSISARIQQEEVQVPNVVAVLPGTDPTLKHEVIGLGSHLDHEGIREGVIYPGADDDGSGTTALLAVAKAFSKNPVKPKRSIVFMAFCGEEMGLIGSGYQANNPFMPLDKMVCELQMDMVGRNEERAGANPEKPEDNVNTIHLVGSKRISTDLHELILNMNKHVGFVFEYDEEGVYSRSDHAMFAAKGVPIAFLFSGFHPDYHQPTDTIEKINFDKIANTAKLFYLTASAAANSATMLRREVRGG